MANEELLLPNELLQLRCLCVDTGHLIEQLKVGCFSCDIGIHQLCSATHAACLLHAFKLFLALLLLHTKSAWSGYGETLYRKLSQRALRLKTGCCRDKDTSATLLIGVPVACWSQYI